MRKSQGFVQGKHLCSLFWCRSSNSIGQNLKQKKEHTLCKYDVNKHFITFCIQSAACTLMISIEETLSYRKTCVTGFVTMTCFNPAFSVPKKEEAITVNVNVTDTILTKACQCCSVIIAVTLCCVMKWMKY